MFEKLFSLRVVLLGFLLLLFGLCGSSLAFASETNGTIDTTYKYAWGENIGWLNFGCDNCDVAITDSEIAGHAWSTQFGWINLNPTTSGVTNTAEGVLAGYAWSSNLGWINFDGVTINSSGEFLGYATLESDSSQINFNCVNGASCAGADFKVKTDWRPASARTVAESGSGGGSSGSRPRPFPPFLPTPPIIYPTPAPIILPPTPIVLLPSTPTPLPGLTNNFGEALSYLYDSFVGFFRPPEKPVEVFVQIPEIAPWVLRTPWNLLPAEAIRSFVFAPLPYEVRVLASKFPELEKTLKDVGIDRLSDLDRLSRATFNLGGLNELEKILEDVDVEQLKDIENIRGVSLNIPGISDISGGNISGLGAGKIALIKGLPVEKFPLVAKQNLPTEFVFARASGELIDLNVAISVGEKGQVTQKISSLPGKTLKLVVKPISSARSVTGYFIFKSATPRITQTSETEISRSSLVASALFSVNNLVERDPEPIEVENKLVVFSFEYTDPDRDGIYTAEVISPVATGEYEIITVIEYIDPTLGTRQMRMITVIDPEGYVFEKNNGKETRIPSAIVSLYQLNVSTKSYELWDAKAYQQENPQITDVRGTYSFLVPEGSYYFEVEAPGYNSYQGKAFNVIEGSGVHQNIELKSGLAWLPDDVDWKTVLLIVVFLLLVYNLYRNRSRDKLLESLEKINGK